MADEFLIGVVQKRVNLAKRVCVVDHKNKFCIQPSTACSACDHVARENFTQVSDVEFTARRDAGGHDVRGASFRQALGHHIAPMHGLTSNGHGSYQTAKRYIVDFVSCRFVDQHDGKDDLSTGVSDGLNRL